MELNNKYIPKIQLMEHLHHNLLQIKFFKDLIIFKFISPFSIHLLNQYSKKIKLMGKQKLKEIRHLQEDKFNKI